MTCLITALQLKRQDGLCGTMAVTFQLSLWHLQVSCGCPACTCLIRDTTVVHLIVHLSTIVHAALLWALPDSDVRTHHLMLNTGCTPARSRSDPSTKAKGVVSFKHAAVLLQVPLSVSEAASGLGMCNVQQMLVCQARFRQGQAQPGFSVSSAAA